MDKIKFKNFITKNWFKITSLFLLLIIVIGSITSAAYTGKINKNLSNNNDAKIVLGSYGEVRKSDIKNLSKVTYYRTEVINNSDYTYIHTNTTINSTTVSYNYWSINYFFTIDFKVGDTYFTYCINNTWDNRYDMMSAAQNQIDNSISKTTALEYETKEANIAYTKFTNDVNILFNNKIDSKNNNISSSNIIASKSKINFSDYALKSNSKLYVSNHTKELKLTDDYVI